MGRKLLIGKNPSVHPIVSLSLVIACMAAIVALFSSLCVLRKKNPPTTEDLDLVTSSPNKAETITEAPSATVVEQEDTKDAAAQAQLPLPPPPAMAHLRGAASCHYRTTSFATEPKFSSSMSMRVQGGGIASRLQSRREEKHDKKHDKKFKHEDSIWKKTIILGEKCRVPADEDDTILYDEKGNKISTYHPKIPASLPVSRQSSFIDPGAIPSSAGQN